MSFSSKFRRKQGSSSRRKRQRDHDDDGDDETTIVREVPGNKRRPLPASLRATSDGDGDGDGRAAEQERFSFASTGLSASGSGTDDATRTFEAQTSTDRDARAVLERNQALNEGGGTNDETGIYRGAAAYKNYIGRTDDEIRKSKYTGTHGPLRASTNVRTMAHFDFQPDICKDYKETGYCGFGDTCKFLHDRGSAKQSWQLERDWEVEKNRKKGAAGGGEAAGTAAGEAAGGGDGGADGELPFACYTCRERFDERARRPVETPCGHFFCYGCAMDSARKKAKCAVCGKRTGGVFHVSARILGRLRAEQRERDGGAVSDEAAPPAVGGAAGSGSGGGGSGWTVVPSAPAASG